MCRLTLYPLAAIMLLAAINGQARGDGGQIRVVERYGDRQVTVFTAPSPMCAGWADISVAVQDASTGEAMRDARVAIELKHPDPEVPVIRATATTEAATNKLLKAALVELPVEGVWKVTIRTTTEANPPSETSFSMQVAPPWPAWITEWPWFCWPVVPILLFIAHRKLVAAQRCPSPHPLPALVDIDKSFL